MDVKKLVLYIFDRILGLVSSIFFVVAFWSIFSEFITVGKEFIANLAHTHVIYLCIGIVVLAFPLINSILMIPFGYKASEPQHMMKRIINAPSGIISVILFSYFPLLVVCIVAMVLNQAMFEGEAFKLFIFICIVLALQFLGILFARLMNLNKLTGKGLKVGLVRFFGFSCLICLAAALGMHYLYFNDMKVAVESIEISSNPILNQIFKVIFTIDGAVTINSAFIFACVLWGMAFISMFMIKKGDYSRLYCDRNVNEDEEIVQTYKRPKREHKRTIYQDVEANDMILDNNFTTETQTIKRYGLKDEAVNGILTIGTDKTSVDKNQYLGCKDNEVLILHNKIKEIGDKAFMNNKNLREIIYHGSMNQFQHIYLGNNWLKGSGTRYIKCFDGILKV